MIASAATPVRPKASTGNSKQWFLLLGCAAAVMAAWPLVSIRLLAVQHEHDFLTRQRPHFVHNNLNYRHMLGVNEENAASDGELHVGAGVEPQSEVVGIFEPNQDAAVDASAPKGVKDIVDVFAAAATQAVADAAPLLANARHNPQSVTLVTALVCTQLGKDTTLSAEQMKVSSVCFVLFSWVYLLEKNGVSPTSTLA